jgi:hypothetical protein
MKKLQASMKWSGIAIISFLFASVAFGQTGLGTITGAITDPDGGIVEGATVQAKNAETGKIYTAASSRTGGFTLSQLPAGSYEVSVPAVGFKFSRYTQKDIAVQAGQITRTDLRLNWANQGVLGDDTFLALHNKYAGLTGPAPRGADRRPDFSGVWNAARDPNPEEAAALPWVAAVMDERRKNNFRDLPAADCLPNDIVPISPVLYKIVQTPSLMVQVFELDPHYRQVFLDGRAHPKNLNPTWMGHSIAKWVGDTLVIDTVGFNDKSWLPNNMPHTELLHVLERYRRPDLAHLNVDVTFEDPGTFTKPLQRHVVWELVPGEEILESICTENNRFRQLAGGK